MTDESRREPVPFKREVESPRNAAGLWMPMMALASAAMLTIVSGIAVMTRAPRSPVVVVESRRAQLERELVEVRERVERNQARVLCRAPVHRGNVDGDPQPYDECIVSPAPAPPPVVP